MLYLEDEKRQLWPSVARALASLETLDMVLCLYPSHEQEIFPAPFLVPERVEYFERATLDDDGVTPPYSRRIRVDDEFLSWLELHTDDFEEWGDSLATYRPRSYALVAAVIPRAGMILVADEFGSALAASGFLLSDEPPDWWNRD
ncbi:MAG: hypothetical protein Q8M66_08425 [Actinomycetota bacterium]|nr:hypothetical protein [Actinomycetota bacterium]MDZ4181004.1 hypothetical protein [Coriobacteriia bacterium]